jgi:hypothetical protein
MRYDFLMTSVVAVAVVIVIVVIVTILNLITGLYEGPMKLDGHICLLHTVRKFENMRIEAETDNISNLL